MVFACGNKQTSVQPVSKLKMEKENNLLMVVGYRIYFTGLLRALQEIKHVKGPAQSGARNCSGN